MKKLLSILLCLVFLAVLFVQPVSALADEPTTEYICKDSFMNTYHGAVVYREIYVHYVDENDKESADWVFIFARKQWEEAMSRCSLIGDRLLFTSSGYYPFTFGYCVYDVKAGTFTGISDLFATGDVHNFDGLAEYWNSLEYGTPLGDSDGDKKLTVMDATYIQRALVGLCEFRPADDLTDYIYVGVDYISDYDKDGVRTIMDATAIQVKLARK